MKQCQNTDYYREGTETQPALFPLCGFELTSNHDSANVGSVKIQQHPGGFCLQLVLHNDQTQELHVGLDVISVDRRDAHVFRSMCSRLQTAN